MVALTDATQIKAMNATSAMRSLFILGRYELWGCMWGDVGGDLRWVREEMGRVVLRWLVCVWNRFFSLSKFDPNDFLFEPLEFYGSRHILIMPSPKYLSQFFAGKEYVVIRCVEMNGGRRFEGSEVCDISTFTGLIRCIDLIWCVYGVSMNMVKGGNVFLPRLKPQHCSTTKTYFILYLGLAIWSCINPPLKQ